VAQPESRSFTHCMADAPPPAAMTASQTAAPAAALGTIDLLPERMFAITAFVG